MSKLDDIQNHAEKALRVYTKAGGVDCFFWDRSQRLVRNIELICQLPDLATTNLQIDRFCLTTAAYFSVSGLAYSLNGESANHKSQSFNGNGNGFLKRSAEITAEKLDGLIEAGRIDKIANIITESENRFSNRTESMILSDARNLDDFGTIGIVNEFRQHARNGRGISDVLGIWQRKIEYGYWQARLKESFRFESVRKIAEQRFLATEHFMEQLEIENTSRDMKYLFANSSEV